MYRDFFGLKVLPFNNTPDPRFFFNTPDHEEALASLLYAAEQRKGFVLVTGEVGSGKTLLSRLLLNKLGTGARTAVINNTRLTGHELLLAICREFDVEVQEDATAAELSHLLERYLLEQYSRDRLAVVILDEAQNLPMESFEELRMLGNLEADDAKLLQVLILGQPELQAAFRSSSMRQLHQRMFRTFHLRALTRELTTGYIRHRLQVAGLPAAAQAGLPEEGNEVFTADALEAIYEHSEGIPRLVNQICDNAMLAAYTDSTKQVTVKVIDEVVEQMMSLTVGAGSPTPRGAFARELLGSPQGDHRRDAGATRGGATGGGATYRSGVQVGPSSHRQNTGGTPVPPGPTPRDSFGDQSPQDDRTMHRMMERLEALERALVDGRGDRRDSDETPVPQEAAPQEAVPQRRWFNGAERSARRAKKQAADFAKAFDSAREAEQRIYQVLQRAEHTSERIEERAKETLDQSEKQNAVLQAQAKHLLKEVHAYASGQQQGITDLLSQERAECEAAHQMRREASNLLKKVESTAREANERLRKMLEEAGQASECVKKRAAETLSESDEHGATVRERVARFLDDVRARTEAHEKGLRESIERGQARFETAAKQVDELADQMKRRTEAFDGKSREVLGYVQKQIGGMGRQLDALRELAEKRSSEVNASLESFMAAAGERIEASHRQLVEVVSAARTDVEHTRESLEATEKRIVAEAAAGQSQANEILDQTKDLLIETREQAASLLTGLRAQVTEQAEKSEQIWQTAIAKGSKSLSELHARLDEARLLTDRSRAELDTLVQSAADRLAGTRNAFEASLTAHKTQLTSLRDEADGAKAEIAKRFDEARKDLDTAIEQHRQNLRKRVIKLMSDTEGTVSTAETKAGKTIELLRAELKAASGTAERIYGELQQSVAALQGKAQESQEQYNAEAKRVSRELVQLGERNHNLLDEAQGRVDGMSQCADETAGTLSKKVEELRQAAKIGVTNVGQELDTCLADALKKAERIRTDSEAVAADLAKRMDRTQTQAQAAVANAEEAVTGIRNQSKASLAEVRSSLAQMSKRSELVRRDLIETGDEVSEAARTAHEQLQQTAAGVTERIESLYEAARSDAETNHGRLVELRGQVEKGAEQIRENAAKLLDQVQEGTTSLRDHADELMSQAQSGSEKIGEQAAHLLDQARTSAECFREQAEALLRRAEANAQAIRTEVHTLRRDVLDESEQVREKAAAVKQEIVDARATSTEIVDHAKAIHSEIEVETRKEAENVLGQVGEAVTQARAEATRVLGEAREVREAAGKQAEELLSRADQITDRTAELLKMPKELVDEANQRAAALSELSKKVSGVVADLSVSNTSAERRKEELNQAAASADETLGLLKRHTTRVGQLVGIIRQLYGTMDARIERLRSRLNQADDLCRSVPMEIAGFRDALADEVSVKRQGVDNRKSKVERAEVGSQASIVTASGRRKAGADGQTIEQGSEQALGGIVKRNRKLNAWLRDVLGDEQTQTPAGKKAKSRTHQGALTDEAGPRRPGPVQREPAQA